MTAIEFLRRYRPNSLVKSSARGEYQLAEHDSFKINGESSVWHWKSRDIGGKSALKYLIYVEGVPFVEAVQLLCEESPMYIPVQHEAVERERPLFRLPNPALNNDRVTRYLLGRGISLPTIRYADAVDEAVKKDIADFNGDLMQYYHEDDSVRSKVVNAVPSVEIHGNKLCGCLNVELQESLNEGEQAVLCDYISGQYSDGWGEGFEQRDIRVDDGTLAVHFWQEDGFEMTPEREMQQESATREIRPKMKLIGQDGNIFAIMGRASRLLKNAGQSDKAKEMCNRVMASKSYNAALAIVSEYVETELTPKTRNKPNRGDAR